MASSRKWLITINNPLEHGFDHARIKAAVLDLPSVVYWCMCDEQGDECETLHSSLASYGDHKTHGRGQIVKAGRPPQGHLR